ncbi:MAG: NUDIX domain-containing protein [Gammaproteobacteria bacterium]|nr:NUDIX domain-containing protein [Gammaproteobacteria bacterium]
MGRRQRKVLSCGAVVVRDSTAGPRLLMLRSFGHWDFPKGLLENGEDPRQAALREVQEETTLDDLTFPWGDEFFESGPYSRGKTARYYLARTARSDVAILPNPETGRPEHAEIRWLSLAEARRLAAPRVKAVIEWAVGRMG